MRILLTNDDGISSPGIRLLACALRKAGHRVFVLAPSSDRSGVSHSITFFNGPCHLAGIEADTWSCGGTPADCVVIALTGGIPELRFFPDGKPDDAVNTEPPHLILSGINRGANLGTDIVYSGTAAAARQGSLVGIPAIALSLVEHQETENSPQGDVWHWDAAVSFAVEHLEEMRACWKPGSFVNINIPNSPEGPSALVHAFPSLRYYNDSIDIYDAPDGKQYCFAQVGKISAKPERGSDWDVVSENKASMSAIYIHPVLLEAVNGRGEP
jgi:5'-nucleotidase